MAEKLTYAQNLAVTNRGGKLLVSAAAGSGKTKVLVDRLIRYLTDPVQPANIDDFLIITYTKAAAAELRGKIAGKISEHIAQDPGNRHLQRQMQRLYLAKISTVHAFCADILREYAYRLDLTPDFRVADENESIHLRGRAMEAVLEVAYSQIGENSEFRSFMDTQGLGRTDALVPELIEQVYDSAMCHLNPKQWMNCCVEDLSACEDPLDTPWGRYLTEMLFHTLDGYISALERCCSLLNPLEGMEKPITVLSSAISQMKVLRASKTWDEIVSNKNIDYGRLVFAKKYDVPEITDQIKAVRMACREALDKKLRWFSDPAERVQEDLRQSYPAAKGLIQLVEAFSEEYRRLKRNARVLDFSDLEHRTLDLLWGKSRTGPTAVADEVAKRYREIMVDEYQDSNSVQDAIFEALTKMKNNLFMVGDVKQSIYQFRLADPGIFLEKYSTYLPAEIAQPGEGRKILLSRNFRSSAGVISAVNDVFRDCMSETVGGLTYGEEEALQEGLPHCSIGEAEVELHCVAVREDTYEEEAAYAAERIAELLDGGHWVRDGENLRPVRPDDIVILLRSPGSVGGYFQMALERRGIPCAGSGGGDLLLTEEVGTLRSLLQIISNPRQDIPLIAVLASPVFGFTADHLAKLRGKSRSSSFYDAVRQSESSEASYFLAILEELRYGASVLALPELLELIFRLTGLDAVYGAMEDGNIRKDNLRSFYQLAVDFSAMGISLDRFLEHLDALAERGIPTGFEQPCGCVTIMSIHKSKGLEFPVVFLCGLSRRFNKEDLRQQILCHKELGLGLSCVDRKNRVRYPTLSHHAIGASISAESVSEELRILYVAMTRARDRLIMTYAAQNLENNIHDIAMTMDISGQMLMTCDVSCPGEWVLYSALKRTEAGALFAIGGRPQETRSSDHPWKITVGEAMLGDLCAPSQSEKKQVVSPAVSAVQLKQLLHFSYPHEAATLAPSKQTATQKKGRLKDQEAAEQAGEQQPIHRTWRKPAFAQTTVDGTTYGNAMHAAMQHISYSACTDVNAIRAEVDRLAGERFLTQQQASLIDCSKLNEFFASDIGKRLRNDAKVLREFKFSILDDASAYGNGLEGEKVLLQGVVDCALIEDDGIIIIDFKTDHTTEDTLTQIRQRYTDQIEAYAGALSHIFEKPVKQKLLYLFSMGIFLQL